MSLPADSTIHVTEFTDPGCPWSFAGERWRLRLTWLYGDHLDWRLRMIGFITTAEEMAGRGFDTERQARSMERARKSSGLPIDSTPRSRMASTHPACTAVIAVRCHRPALEWQYLRRLRVRAMAGQLLDMPETLAAAADDVGITHDDLVSWCEDPRVAALRDEDFAMARGPSAAALAQPHRLGRWGSENRWRYGSPSIELVGPGGATFSVPGAQPLEVYEAAIANLSPSLQRRGNPDSLLDILEWAPFPLATCEVAAVAARPLDDVRQELQGESAEFEAVASDGYWSV